MKTYAEICLKRAGDADEGPWTTGSCGEDYRKVIGPSGYAIVIDVSPMDADFIAASRTDVPELAKRLTLAIQTIRDAAIAVNGYSPDTSTMDVYSIRLLEFADKLEDMPEE